MILWSALHPFFRHVSRNPRWTNAEMKTRTLGHTLLKIHRFNSMQHVLFCAESMSSIWNICVSFPKWKVEHLRQTTHSWGPWQEKKHLDVSLLQKPVANLKVGKDSTIVGRRSTPLQGTLGHWLIREEMQKWRTFYVSMYPIGSMYIYLHLIDMYDKCR